MSEQRRLSLNPEFKHTVSASVQAIDGQIVTVESWHDLFPQTKTAKMFPNDSKVGFVLEILADLPESELLPI